MKILGYITTLAGLVVSLLVAPFMHAIQAAPTLEQVSIIGMLISIVGIWIVNWCEDDDRS